MTKEQAMLLSLIEYQRNLVAKYPGDIVEETKLDTLYVNLRETFQVVAGDQEVITLRRANLQRVV